MMGLSMPASVARGGTRRGVGRGAWAAIAWTTAAAREDEDRAEQTDEHYNEEDLSGSRGA